MTKTYIKSKGRISCILEIDDKDYLITVNPNNYATVTELLKGTAHKLIKPFNGAKEQDFNTKLSFAHNTAQKERAFSILNSQFKKQEQ